MYRKMKQSYHGAMAKRTRKGEQHDRNADTGASSQDASPNGSEVSVRPDGSQELSSDETAAPGGAARTPSLLLRDSASTLTSMKIKESQRQEQLSN